MMEIYEVMISKAMKLKRKYCPTTSFSIPEFSEIDLDCLQECLSIEFTQAEITNAITEQIFIYISIKVSENTMDWNNVTPDVFNKLLRDSIESHKKTQEAIKNCNFNNANPTDIEYNKTCEDAQISVPRSGLGVPSSIAR
jgi:hypothetical protein